MVKSSEVKVKQEGMHKTIVIGRGIKKGRWVAGQGRCLGGNRRKHNHPNPTTKLVTDHFDWD